MPDYTTNFNLEKPLANEYFDIEIQNRNMDAIDGKLKENADSIVDIKNSTEKGTSSFVGNGNEVTIVHGLGQVPGAVYITPLENPNGYLGEFWVRYDENNLYVGNSGSFTGQFCWVAMK